MPCDCCSLASRTSSTIVFRRPTLSAMLPMAVAHCSTLPAPSLERAIDSSISPAVSRAAWAERCARLRTSSATTAKPMPASPRAGGLDGGVEREDVRLERDLVDRLDDARDLLARLADLGHRDDHRVEHAARGRHGPIHIGHE